MATSSIVVRMAFWTYWLFIYFGAAIIFTILLFICDGTKIDWPLYGVSLTCNAFVVAIWTWGMQWLCVVRLTDTKITGLNTLCFPKTFLWEEVSTMKPFNFLGLKWLRVYSTKHYWALWFPLQISNHSSTREKIANLGEKAHWLSNYL